ncbi:hypothetical protein HH682_11545 [Rosenbergiella sp. S61]|uniref:Uncharacterized protein n=1 Tax=Rosenbergiella gaditana TaxID=2726987 RepID=A0ABS5T214_9GAMM|nr:hypothetical protein [Rosenbergiella gaditana]MBT0725038.1 hypothetical protein [Rosenbergiella gaditana]
MVEEAKRGLTYNMALQEGLEPESYDWKNIPEGVWRARLEFKIWSNKSRAGHLVCYMTYLEESRRYRLSAFRQGNGTTRYTPKDGGIDFSEKGLEGHIFLVTTVSTSKGGSAWMAAEYDD